MYQNITHRYFHVFPMFPSGRNPSRNQRNWWASYDPPAARQAWTPARRRLVRDRRGSAFDWNTQSSNVPHVLTCTYMYQASYVHDSLTTCTQISSTNLLITNCAWWWRHIATWRNGPHAHWLTDQLTSSESRTGGTRRSAAGAACRRHRSRLRPARPAGCTTACSSSRPARSRSRYEKCSTANPMI